jgi:hypothetical protein
MGNLLPCGIAAFATETELARGRRTSGGRFFARRVRHPAPASVITTMAISPLAGLGDVRISRDGDAAIIEYPGDPPVLVRIAVGLRARTLTDQEILDLHNQRLLAMTDAMIAAPQVIWDERAGCWRPHGRVVACVVDAGAGLDEPLVAIDDVELSLGELGRLLAGHGAAVRLLFIDD